jgi:ribonuclease BN (tRNA processing enzyme)
MSEVRLIPLGVGDAFSALNYTTCLAIGVGDDWLLLDCPHPIRKMLREASTAAGLPFDLDRVLAVAISHLHADHCSGLEDYGFYSHYVLGRRARVLAHPDVSERLWHGLLAAGMEQMHGRPDDLPTSRTLDHYFDLVPLSTSAAVPLGPFTVECRRTVHTLPTTAFRVRAGGRTVAFSADTAFDPTLIDWLSAADLIVHEATSNPENSAIHTPYERLAALPEALRARLRLVHYPDDFDLEASTIEPLRQGRLYVV